MFNYWVEWSSEDYQYSDCFIILMGAMSCASKLLLLKVMASTKRNALPPPNT